MGYRIVVIISPSPLHLMSFRIRALPDQLLFLALHDNEIVVIWGRGISKITRGISKITIKNKCTVKPLI